MDHQLPVVRRPGRSPLALSFLQLVDGLRPSSILKTRTAITTAATKQSRYRKKNMVFTPKFVGLFLVALLGFARGLSVGGRSEAGSPSSTATLDRRAMFAQTALAGAGMLLTLVPEQALASGGATAGKYTTIPIAKRRYYGRVQQAVHDFLAMGNDVVKGDMTAPAIQLFFDPQGIVVVPAKNKSINGQCTKKDSDCRGKEIRDSRYNDMKASMYLLGNAFRTDQQKPPDRLPTVKAAKAFFKEMNEREKLVTKRPKKNDPDAVAFYAAALDILDNYLDLVELPPTNSGHYDQEFDTLVGETARIT